MNPKTNNTRNIDKTGIPKNHQNINHDKPNKIPIDIEVINVSKKNFY